MKDENGELRARLSDLQQSRVVITAEERQSTLEQRRRALLEWRKRRRMTRAVLDAILEGWPKSKAELYEEVGIDTDESVGVTMPEQ